MNLDDRAAFAELDSQNMLEQINHLPDQLTSGWDEGWKKPLLEGEGIHHVLIAGMGGSAIGADLLAAYGQPSCRVPVTVLRDYRLPGWASGPETLVIACSHSGDTEETLTAFEEASKRGCRGMALTRGGKLAAAAQASGTLLWRFEHDGQPRAAVGLTFGMLLAAFTRLELLPDPREELTEAVRVMREQQQSFLPDVPVVRNPAKRMAGQMMGRIVIVMGAEELAPVARRWKSQINELAKAVSQFETLPEADHNSLAGLNHPESALSQMMVLFLQAPTNHPRNRLRLDFSRQMVMTYGINTDLIEARGEGRLAQQWTCLHYGDYASYYLAMAYREDPTPVDNLVMFKDALDQEG